jgi:hypothetical protein
MAIPAIDVTLSGADANSYATLAQATAYFELRPGGKKFLDLNQDEKTAALLFATILIDRETYWGQKETSTQALMFPRTGMSAIPEKVQHAQFEQVLALVNGDYLRQLDQIALQSAGAREVTTKGVRVRFVTYHHESFPAWRLTPQARQLLQGYIEFGLELGRA